MALDHPERVEVPDALVRICEQPFRSCLTILERELPWRASVRDGQGVGSRRRPLLGIGVRLGAGDDAIAGVTLAPEGHAGVGAPAGPAPLQRFAVGILDANVRVQAL